MLDRKYGRSMAQAPQATRHREVGIILGQSEVKSNKHLIYTVEENSVKPIWLEAKSKLWMAANEKKKMKQNAISCTRLKDMN